MAISFNSIPSNWRLPLFYVETDASQAGGLVQEQPALLIGQKFSAGSAPADTPVIIGSLAQAKTLFGEGSMLERMVSTFLQNNSVQQIWCGPVAEPSTGVAASGNIVFSGPATASGTLSLYIADQLVEIGVTAGDTAATIAANVVAAIIAMTTLPVTAVVDGSSTAKAVLTSRWKGATGNDIQVSFNFGGTLAGEAFPGGVGATITALSGGVGQPSLTNLIAGLGDDEYDFVANPFTDSTSLASIEDEYGFGDNGRWGWLRQLYGQIWSARRGTYSDLVTFYQSRNTAQTSILAIEPTMPTPVWEVAAAYAAQAARALMNDPARPLQTLALAGVTAAPRADRFNANERNTLAIGLATQAVRADGTVQIERESTTYQTNAFGVSDDSYAVATTLATLARIFRELKSAITTKYPRHKLANNGTQFGAGQAIVTPNIIKAELIAVYDALEEIGLVENTDQFTSHLVVERSAENPNRVDVLLPPDLVNQLRMFAVLGQFRLQYADNASSNALAP
ncbi:tail sheath protein [Kaistia sp. 32K]|uniref:phage tail sheath C-terminal domain-containing protein n=1 Tax=Kaistia sp. 32K TaxID=2795690 RepID=UPI001914ED29|nr:phage tail sheath C-terminal domain-containing protein [Kaistia sp. 32K]BCP53784.1 tail sheath protein [Kaistia sp. 32K]